MKGGRELLGRYTTRLTMRTAMEGDEYAMKKHTAEQRIFLGEAAKVKCYQPNRKTKLVKLSRLLAVRESLHGAWLQSTSLVVRQVRDSGMKQVQFPMKPHLTVRRPPLEPGKRRQ
jgi:hypothetical protein